MGKALKKIAAVALPIAGALTGNPLLAAAGAAVGSKVSGGSWGDALKSGLIGGITGGIGGGFTGTPMMTTGIGFLDDIAGGISSGLSPIGSGLKSGLSGLFGSAPSAAAPSGLLQSFNGIEGAKAASSGLAPLYQGFGQSGANIPGALEASFGTGAGVSPSSSKSGLGSLLSKAGDDPFGALGTLLTVGNAMQGGEVEGTQSQEQILAQMEAEKAKQQQFSDQTIAMLNSASSGRAPVAPSISDYYTYGQRPEALFFDKINTPITYG